MAQATEISGPNSEPKTQKGFSVRRMLGVASFQAVIGAFGYLPFYGLELFENYLILHCRWLDRRFGKGSSPKILLPKIMCDDLAFVPGVEIPTFIFWTSAVEGGNSIERFKAEYLTAALSSLAYNLPLTVINFLFIPPPFRVVFLDVSECIWTGILSYITHLSASNKS
jgi:hypothetical protein